MTRGASPFRVAGVLLRVAGVLLRVAGALLHAAAVKDKRGDEETGHKPLHRRRNLRGSKQAGTP